MHSTCCNSQSLHTFIEQMYIARASENPSVHSSIPQGPLGTCNDSSQSIAKLAIQHRQASIHPLHLIPFQQKQFLHISRTFPSTHTFSHSLPPCVSGIASIFKCHISRPQRRRARSIQQPGIWRLLSKRGRHHRLSVKLNLGRLNHHHRQQSVTR
jgi:hypothetical protein